MKNKLATVVLAASIMVPQALVWADSVGSPANSPAAASATTKAPKVHKHHKTKAKSTTATPAAAPATPAQ